MADSTLPDEDPAVVAKTRRLGLLVGLIISVVPEPQARLAGLKTGEIDIAEPPLDDVSALKVSGELNIVVAENTGQNVFWEFAVHRPPFNDKRARQAVGHATDAELLEFDSGAIAEAPKVSF